MPDDDKHGYTIADLQELKYGWQKIVAERATSESWNN